MEPRATLAPGDRGPDSGPAAWLQLGALAASVAAPHVARRLGRGRAGRWPTVATIALTVVGGNAITAVTERRSPFRPDWNRSRDGDVAVDATYVTLQALAVGSLIGLGRATVLPAVLDRPAAARLSALWPRRAPVPVRLLCALAVAELPHYWWHRLGHGRGWRWHAVHHSPTRLYWLNATRFHFIDMVADSVALSAPLAILGMDEETTVAYSVFGGLFGKIQHANLAGRSGWLDLVFSTPDLHRWHHSTDRRRGEVNFGGRLVLWDQIFGTYARPSAPFEDDIGIVGERFPTTWSSQAIAPFRRRRADTPQVRSRRRVFAARSRRWATGLSREAEER